jgi:hypothetical protein
LYYLDMWVSSFVIIFPLYENSMKDEAKVIWFRFSDAIEEVVKTLHIFDKLWLKRPLILNLPMCLLPWYEDAIIQTFNWTAVLNIDGTKSNIDDNKAFWKKRVKLCKDCEYNKICFWVDEEYINFWWEEEFQEKKEKLNYNFSFDNLNIKKYFTNDELCLIEILKFKNNITIKEIAQLKDEFQICKDCDSMEKIWEVEKRLLFKWIIFVKWKWLNKKYSLVKK